MVKVIETIGNVWGVYGESMGSVGQTLPMHQTLCASVFAMGYGECWGIFEERTKKQIEGL